MTTNIRTLVVLLIATLAGVAGASAQVVSLGDLGHDVYKSVADGFEIAVPHNCFKVTSIAHGRSYVCDVKEGRVAIQDEAGDLSVNTDADLAAYLSGFKGVLETAEGVKILGETPVHVGDFRGVAYQLTVNGDKVFMTTLCWTTFVITITGKADSSVPNAAKLISNAVQSFTLIAKAK